MENTDADAGPDSGRVDRDSGDRGVAGSKRAAPDPAHNRVLIRVVPAPVQSSTSAIGLPFEIGMYTNHCPLCGGRGGAHPRETLLMRS